jgi:hypothetical protein
LIKTFPYTEGYIDFDKNVTAVKKDNNSEDDYDFLKPKINIFFHSNDVTTFYHPIALSSFISHSLVLADRKSVV